ncbi:hypothetical protein NMY22_g2350 [Coprinellus aureogranulatus]|nr:hypothetical protein NMY22_g2350 [Coprinellus aureogranulatus]
MPQTRSSQQAANMFSGSSHLSFQKPTFSAAARDVHSPSFNHTFSPVVNVRLEHPNGGVSLAHEELQSIPVGLRQEADRKRGSMPIQREGREKPPAGVRGIRRVVDWALRFMRLSRRCEQLPCAEESLPMGGYTSDDPTTPSLTLNTRCSSPYDISSRMDFLEPLRPHVLPNFSTPQTYVWHMWKTGRGHALWNPEPPEPLFGQPMAASSPQGNAPGDVGIITPEGCFHKIFNIFDDHPALQDTYSRFGGSELKLPPKNVIFKRNAIRQGGVVTEGALSETLRDESNPGKITSFEFWCRAESGAFLVATSEADSEELKDYTQLSDWTQQHWALIYEHSNSRQRVARNESLYIITHCTKAKSWALGAFKTRADPDELMCLKDLTRDDNGSPDFEWTQNWSSSEGRTRHLKGVP